MSPLAVLATWLVPLAIGVVLGYVGCHRDEKHLRDDVLQRYERLASLAPVDVIDMALWEQEVSA